MEKEKIKVALYKFGACAGCQLQILMLDEHILDLLKIVNFEFITEYKSNNIDDDYDIGLVEGAITCQEDIERLKILREHSKFLVALGACATYGGIIALKNWKNIEELINRVYDNKDQVGTLSTAKPASDYIKIDESIYGCPPNKDEIVELFQSYWINKTPYLQRHAVCVECKAKDNLCLFVYRNLPCMGSVTKAGCKAAGPSVGRPCYGCRGPVTEANVLPLMKQFMELGLSKEDVIRKFRSYASCNSAFGKAADEYEKNAKIKIQKSK